MNPNPFLKEIAQILLQPGEYDLHATTIVFPNKRARLYLSKHIGELTERPVWAPRYLTISELMERISGYSFADRLTLMFELYGSWCRVTGSTESFDTFYPYCETLLADFDEIDKYLADADDLFDNLAGLKSIDGRFNYLSEEQLAHIRRFWTTFQVENISSDQSLFISLWESLPGIYHDFNSKLHSKNMAYEGMAYRKAVENPGESIQNDDAVTQYIFVGFNALNACEEKLFRYLKNSGRAQFFWDYDDWYTNNDIHEAGFFIRKNIKNFPQLRPLEHNHLSSEKKNIFFIPVTSNSGQTAILSNIFEKLELKDNPEIENTALVLADEGLLMTTLYAIPGSINDVNVTMGYPMGSSAVFSLIDALYELMRNSRKGPDGNSVWYFRDVLTIMNNPLLKGQYGMMIEPVRKIILKHHKVYLSWTEIVPEQNSDIIFNDRLHSDICNYLLEVFTGIIRQLPKGVGGKVTAEPIQIELIFQVFTFITRLRDVLREQDYAPGADVLFRLIRKMLRGMHIPFSGEPLAGLQVLGILETRTLDFDNVIMLSCNEGILPKPADKPTFIPFNLRAGFGLPTPEYHDAIYAYYFYRLIQRAKNIALVYDDSSGGLRTGERSRFLHQLKYEMGLPVKELAVESSISQIPVKSIIIQKSGDVKDALERYMGEDGKILSPSAINEFLNCPMRFYFRHIAGLPQIEEVTEEIDARMFGNLLHSALKMIYEEFGHNVITRTTIETILKDESTINSALDKAFSEILLGDSPGSAGRKPEGYNLIVRQVIYTYIRQFLRAEIESCPFTIVALEEKYFAKIPITTGGVQTEVRVGGIIDRIDRHEGRIRILDYKTGAVKDKFLSMGSLFDSGEKLRNDAVFQVLLYSYVFSRNRPEESIFPGLFFLRQSHSGDFSPSIQMGSKKGEVLENFESVKSEFESGLKEGLENLFDLRTPFVQTDNLLVCKHCNYKMICRRE